MLLLELSKSMGDLAIVINKKTAELDAVKSEYSKKLSILNKYIEKIEKLTQPQEGELKRNGDESLLQNSIDCPNCHHKVYDLESESEFILIPCNKFILLCDTSDELPNERQSSQPAHEGNSSQPARDTGQPNAKYLISTKPKASKSGNSKKTCSYCHKSGHSRARCFTRLSKEPITQ